MLPKHNFQSAFVDGRNIDEVWFKLLYELCEKGRFYKITEGSYKDDFRLEFDNIDGVIYYPIEYNEYGVRLPIAPTVPQGCPAPTTDKDIEDYKESYLKNSILAPNEHYKYATFINGGRYKIPSINLLSPKTIFAQAKQKYSKLYKFVASLANECINDPLIQVPNQLEWCKEHFRKKGFGNNHCCICVAYPESNLAYDLPYKDETDRGTSPCLRLIDMKITYEPEPINEYFLNWYVYFRSWDLWGGWPVNMGGLALLMEETAYDLGIFPGVLKFGSKGLHVYGHSIEPLVMRSGNDRIICKFNEMCKG